jgi:16S rRNA (guanine527-N7)-methyltransferase
MEIIEKYFTGLSAKQKSQFAALEAVYKEWNEKINVISRKDTENLYERHVLHSLGIAKVISFKPQTSILDAGTGGGFPGIPLAILFPESVFLLVDSIGKKIKVVDEVIKTLQLPNVRAMNARMETVKWEFDFITCRAVTKLPEFLNWSKGKIVKKGFNDLPNGILYLKGGDLQDEIGSLQRHFRVYELSKYFEEEFFETKKLVHIW